MKSAWHAAGASAMLGLALLACGGKGSSVPDAAGAGGDATGSSGSSAAQGGSSQQGGEPRGGSSGTSAMSGASGDDTDPPGDQPCLEDPRVPPCEMIEDRPLPGPRPICPEAEPMVGDPCSEPSLLCSYGDSPTPTCRSHYECTPTGWILDPRMSSYPCNEPAPGYCPAEPPPPGTECTPISHLAPCVYADVSCSCLSRFHWATQGVDSWLCFGPPRDAQCPRLLPNIGEGCSTPGVQCSYLEDCDFPPNSTVFCHSGAWEEGYRPPPCLQ